MPLSPPSYVTVLRERFKQVASLAKEELGACQGAQKRRYDSHVKVRQVQGGQRILLLLPLVKNPSSTLKV